VTPKRWTCDVASLERNGQQVAGIRA